MSERGAVSQAFSRAAARYGAAASLQRAVCDRLLAMLPPVSARRVLDLGCGTGFASTGLLGHYPDARLFAADFSPGMLAAHEAADRCERICTDAHCLPFADASIDLVFSSLMLQWCDPARVFAECARVLQPAGTLCLTTVLDGTLAEIDRAFSDVDAHRHTVAFPDESALRSALASSGLLVEGIERATRVEYFADARSLLQSNRNIGASHVPGGRRVLLGRAAWQQVCRRFEATRTGKGLPLSYELVWLTARPAAERVARR